jgi:hypothetical protein
MANPTGFREFIHISLVANDVEMLLPGNQLRRAIRFQSINGSELRVTTTPANDVTFAGVLILGDQSQEFHYDKWGPVVTSPWYIITQGIVRIISIMEAFYIP